MKLSDIDENLAEAPVGILKRAATKLKKHTPFNRAARERAAGEEVTQKAARELASSFNTWLGKVKADPDIDHKNLTVEDLMDFFKDEGFARTAQEVIQAAAKKKSTERTEPTVNDEEPAGRNEPTIGDEKPEQSEEDVRKSYADHFSDLRSESLEARLGKMLNEDNGNPVTFSPKEVERLILTIVSKVHRENPDGLAARVRDTEGSGDDDGSTQSIQRGDARSTGVVSDEEFQRIRDRLDNFVKDVEGVIKSEKDVDDKVKSVMLKKLNRLQRQVKSELS